jgi:hypothetical protein
MTWMLVPVDEKLRNREYVCRLLERKQPLSVAAVYLALARAERELTESVMLGVTGPAAGKNCPHAFHVLGRKMRLSRATSHGRGHTSAAA